MFLKALGDSIFLTIVWFAMTDGKAKGITDAGLIKLLSLNATIRLRIWLEVLVYNPACAALPWGPFGS